MKNILYTIILCFLFSSSVFAGENDSELLQGLYDSMRHNTLILLSGSGEITEDDYNNFWQTEPLLTIEQKKDFIFFMNAIYGDAMRYQRMVWNCAKEANISKKVPDCNDAFELYEEIQINSEKFGAKKTIQHAKENTTRLLVAAATGEPMVSSQGESGILIDKEIIDETLKGLDYQFNRFKKILKLHWGDWTTGLKAYNTGDYATAYKEFKILADQGDYLAQYNLGLMYAHAEGVTQDYKEAMKWFLLSAEQGFANAQYHIGVMYDQGLGFDCLEYAEAVKWYRLAAEQGLPVAQYNLAHMYKIGAGIVENPIIAYMWFSVAIDNGYQDAKKSRNKLAKKITAEQIIQANEAARKCIENNHKDCGTSLPVTVGLMIGNRCGGSRIK